MDLASLTWPDLTGDTLTLRAEHSKNRTARDIPVIGELAEIISRRRLQMSPLTPLIFHRNGKCIGDFRVVWRRACALAGVPGKLFHDLRRSAVRDMVRAGTPESVAMKLSGHKTRSMFDSYSITSDGDKRTALEQRQSYNARQEVSPSTGEQETTTGLVQ